MCIRNSPAGGTPSVQVYNVSRLGAESEITSGYALSAPAHSVNSASKLQESRLVKSKTDGQFIRIKAPAGIIKGATMYISFLNRSILQTP
jgi:hypothetical protein